jgi:DNA helicase-2/ATP-dependent DNA helicase PcrA
MLLDLSKLNKEQKEAVTHKEGPLLIVAGAGTGKTTVITQRISYLIEQKLAKPEEILAVTFTEKAAEEMEERVDRLLPIGYMDLWVSTFHSFCERVLKDYALEIGLPSDFKILDETAAWLMVFKNFDQFKLDYYKPLGNPTKFIQALLSHFSHCKDQEIYPKNYLSYAKTLSSKSPETKKIKEVANAYSTYQKLLLDQGYLDFGDLINYCLELFKKRPQILKKFKNQFKYILVDEFQDTNWAQYELVKILSAPKNNLTVCADDDQAIYRFRGASFSNIIQFKKDFKKAREISLVNNYRSCQNILDLSYSFIKANDPDRLECVSNIQKKLVAKAQKGKAEIEHIHSRTLEEEVSSVIGKIMELKKKDKGSLFSDFAILVRANNTANPFIKALERAGLPYQFLASRGLYSNPSVLDVISFFKLLDNYHESSALFRIFSLPFLNIPIEDLMKLNQYAFRKTKSLFEVAQELPLVLRISKKGAEKIGFLMGLIKKYGSVASQKPASEIMVGFLEDSGYLKHLVKENNEEELDLLNQFFKKIKRFEESSQDSSLISFMQEMKLELESGEEGKISIDMEQGPDVIKVMTIHGAKGLEFKYVFLVNMVDKRFPSTERKDQIELPDKLIKDIKPKGDVHLQEERRICYVAMTRAKEGLYFTSAEDYGGTRRKKLSRFLVEMGYKEKNSIGVKDNELVLRIPKTTKGSRSPWKLPEHFSYSQLAAFEKCPLQYKFNFLLKIPTRGGASRSFGITLHNTLYQFLKRTGSSFKIEDLYEQNWIDDWYENKKQKEEYFKLGKEIVKDFYRDCKKNPINVLKINGEPALETTFNLKIGGYTVKGKIDRIDDSPLGVSLIDYKTGKAKDKLTPDEKEQLLLYQIAAEEILGLQPKELVYHYLNDNKKISFLGSEPDKQKLKEKIIKTIEAIRSSDFKAKPGWQCSFCDFRYICEFSRE